MAAGSALTKLRGLPYNSTESDISTFFEGFQTKLIHVCRKDGKPREHGFTTRADKSWLAQGKNAISHVQEDPRERRTLSLRRLK